MDTKVVSTIRNALGKPETKAVLTEPGTRHGRLTVSGRNALGNVVLRCECGETIRLSSGQVMSGKYYQCESCDKWDRKTPAHRLVGTQAYKSLASRGYGARDRCLNASHQSYPSYGGRGIRFNFDDIEHYVQYMAPAVMTFGTDGQVDRIDNDGNYEPGNLRIISVRGNGRNRRSTIFIDGVPLGEVCEKFGFNPMDDLKIYSRISEKVKYRIGSGGLVDTVFLEDAIKSARKTPVAAVSKPRAKRQPVIVCGRTLRDILDEIGFGDNMAVYHNTRGRVSYRLKQGSTGISVEMVKSLAVRYAKARGLEPNTPVSEGS